MGLFQSKKQTQVQKSQEEMIEELKHFFDENFREELRNHGRWFFEKIITENGLLFKQELETTIEQVNAEVHQHITAKLEGSVEGIDAAIKQHITTKLDEQIDEYRNALKGAQEAALQSISSSAKALEDQHRQLSQVLQKNIADQEAMITDTLVENKKQIETIKSTQEAALQSIASSAKALEDQHRQLSQVLQKNIADQEAMIVQTFQDNMAQIVEHYLLGVVGEEFDIKSQLPSIVKQLEKHKQEILDDIKL